MAILIHTDGIVECMKNTSLTSLQEAVGGHIEIVRAKDGTHLFVVNEEGKLQHLDINQAATNLACRMGAIVRGTDYLVGDVVFSSTKEID